MIKWLLLKEKVFLFIVNSLCLFLVEKMKIFLNFHLTQMMTLTIKWKRKPELNGAYVRISKHISLAHECKPYWKSRTLYWRAFFFALTSWALDIAVILFTCFSESLNNEIILEPIQYFLLNAIVVISPQIGILTFLPESPFSLGHFSLGLLSLKDISP